MSKADYRQIIVGERPASLQGLDEVFDDLYARGFRPNDLGLGPELAEPARQRRNFVPSGQKTTSPGQWRAR